MVLLASGYWCMMNGWGFDILHEDSACLVVNKPGALLTQAPLGIDSLEVRVKRMLKERGEKPGDVYLGVPHRLDRPASGAMVFAKNVRAARRISEQFEERLVDKKYWALAQGVVEPDAATWTDHLKKIEGEPRTVVVDFSDLAGRIAILRYRCLERLRLWSASLPASGLPLAEREDHIEERLPAAEHRPEATLLEIELETGRTHQIRVQCASRGHPLLGDELYGSPVPFGPPSDDVRERLIALHARSLRFRHPTTREYIAVDAPLPEAWAAVGVNA